MPQLDWTQPRQRVGTRLFLSKKWTTLSRGGPGNKCRSSSTTVAKYKYKCISLQGQLTIHNCTILINAHQTFCTVLVRTCPVVLCYLQCLQTASRCLRMRWTGCWTCSHPACREAYQARSRDQMGSQH